MPATRPKPTRGSYYLDSRGDGRALRVSWHLEDGVGNAVVVLSLWRENVCTGTFRLGIGDVAELVSVLSAGLGAAVEVGAAS